MSYTIIFEDQTFELQIDNVTGKSVFFETSTVQIFATFKHGIKRYKGTTFLRKTTTKTVI